MDAPLKHGGNHVAQTLMQHDVKYVFTLCGGHISPILTGCNARGIKVIDVRNEATAVFAADAVSRLSNNIGVATDTQRGLVVPVIKNIDKKSIKLISNELTTLVYKAKEKRLTIDDMAGGCFTISNL